MKAEFEESDEIRAVDILAALVALWRANDSGSLRFTRTGASAGIDLAQGEIVGVFSSEPRFETAAILVRAGKLEAGSLERLAVAPGGDAALAALGAGILTRREWKWGEKIRAIEILSDLLAWPEGRYAFDRVARPSAGDFTLTVPRLLLELFLRSRDRNLIEHQLGPTDLSIVRSRDFDREFATFGLTADAESVVRLIDGRSTAAEIAEEAPAEEFAVLKLLAALKTLGLIRSAIEEEQEEEPAEEPAATELPGEPRVVETEPEPEREEEPAPEPFPVIESGPLDERGAGELPIESQESPLEWSDLSVQAPAVEAGLDAGSESPSRDLEAERADLFDARLSAEEAATELPEPAAEWTDPAETPSEPVLPPPESLPPERRRAGPGLLLTAIVLLLGAAVAAILIVRSRPVTSAPAATPAAASAPAPTSAPIASAQPTAASASPAQLSPASASPAAARQPPQPQPQTRARAQAQAVSPAAPTAVAGRAGRQASAPAAPWAHRAERDRARLAADRRTRYAIQLELACEESSLAEAWRYDRPTGSLWLLPTLHRGRNCYRVFWGRYPSLAAARAGKAGVPRFFSTPTNHPAVVSVR